MKYSLQFPTEFQIDFILPQIYLGTMNRNNAYGDAVHHGKVNELVAHLRLVVFRELVEIKHLPETNFPGWSIKYFPATYFVPRGSIGITFSQVDIPEGEVNGNRKEEKKIKRGKIGRRQQ